MSDTNLRIVDPLPLETHVGEMGSAIEPLKHRLEMLCEFVASVSASAEEGGQGVQPNTPGFWMGLERQLQDSIVEVQTIETHIDALNRQCWAERNRQTTGGEQ